MKTLTLLLAFLAASTTLADPPTPPPKPRKWDFLGTYQIGVGEQVSVVIDPDSISRDGDIVLAFVGRDFTKVDGQWAPDLGWIVISYKIDCKFHTYNELWYEDSRGFRDTRDEWIAIEPDSGPALAAKRLCANPYPKKP